jgi:hypothetical protein
MKECEKEMKEYEDKWKNEKSKWRDKMINEGMREANDLNKGTNQRI